MFSVIDYTCIYAEKGNHTLYIIYLLHCFCDPYSPSVTLGFSDIFDLLPHFLAYSSEQAIVVPAPIIASASVKIAIIIHSTSAKHESPTTDVGCL